MAKATITSPTGALKTGDAKQARKAGKAATFVVTQETFDAAFEAGRVVGGAMQAAAQAMFPLLSPLSGRSDETAIAQWNEYRRGFMLGMAAERSIDPASASRMFVRIVDFLALDKPQSAAAKAKAEKRAAAKSADGAGEAGEAGEDTPLDGAGETAAQAVTMALSKLEAHLIAMLRAGKTTLAAQLIADGQF